MTTHAAVAPAVSIRTTERTPPADLVVGIGMSSRATAAEVRELVERTLVEHDLDADRIALIATRVRFAGDDRLRLGPPVVGIDDARLEAMSEPCTRTVGIRARVAETAARLAAAGAARDLVVARSAHVMLAIVTISTGADAAAGG